VIAASDQSRSWRSAHATLNTALIAEPNSSVAAAETGGELSGL